MTDFVSKVRSLVGLGADVSSRVRLFRLGLGFYPTPTPVEVRLRDVPFESVWMRPHTSDWRVALETFRGRYHLIPPGREPIQVILDLGSNIGLTMVDYASRHPSARVYGVELDDGNAAVCRTNIDQFGNQCKLYVGAVWPREQTVAYQLEKGEEWAARVAESERARVRTTRTLTLNGLVDKIGEPIDFLKMDVEGAEREILRGNTEWAEQVRCVKVEVHEPYTVAECREDLTALGFATTVESGHWACVRGERDVA
ncbi:MAG: FkbM family methyltransferase [Actinobacteria bacterium]|nr:FkbM family methyltransferase [Actinomycetota bacterium]